jgi:hypothetical protein
MLVLLAAVLPATAPEAIPRKELASQKYEIVQDPVALPAPVQAAWATALGQKTLHVAAPGADFNTSDMGFGGLPRHRLILAAVSPSYAVVHCESGGIASSWRVYLFSRNAEGAALVWRGHSAKAYRDPGAFLRAIKNGKLWKGRRIG